LDTELAVLMASCRKQVTVNQLVSPINPGVFGSIEAALGGSQAE
jgi:hypothetical protein